MKVEASLDSLRERTLGPKAIGTRGSTWLVTFEIDRDPATLPDGGTIASIAT